MTLKSLQVVRRSETKARICLLSLLFRASDKSSDQRPNNAWFRERQAGATVHSTTMAR
jgi:hypothetical protein